MQIVSNDEILFTGKIKKNITSLSTAKLVKIVVKAKHTVEQTILGAIWIATNIHFNHLMTFCFVNLQCLSALTGHLCVWKHNDQKHSAY